MEIYNDANFVSTILFVLNKFKYCAVQKAWNRLPKAAAEKWKTFPKLTLAFPNGSYFFLYFSLFKQVGEKSEDLVSSQNTRPREGSFTRQADNFIVCWKKWFRSRKKSKHFGAWGIHRNLKEACDFLVYFYFFLGGCAIEWDLSSFHALSDSRHVY